MKSDSPEIGDIRGLVLRNANVVRKARNTSGSLWPVVIAHGTFNAVLGALAGAAVVGNPATAAYLTRETGVFTLLALIIVAWVLVSRTATRKEDQLARDTH
jgi:hypothetical protein